MPRAPIELTVIQKAYEFVVWSTKHLERFPKTHRYELGSRISNRLYAVLEGLIEAKYTTLREPLLKRANLDLEVLRFQFRAWFNSASHWVAEPRPLGSGVLAILQWIPLPDGRASATSL